MRSRDWVVAGLAFALTTSCGKSEVQGPVTLEEFTAGAAAARCDSLGGCCDRASHSFDRASCEAATTLRLVALWSEDEKVEYNPAVGGACLDQLRRSMSCGQANDADGALSACDDLFVGTVPVGGECRSTSQCQGVRSRGAQCVFNDDGEEGSGVCTIVERTTPARGKAGDACVGTCNEGEGCSLDVAPTAGGQPPVNVACYIKDGLYCQFNDRPRCQPLVAVGEPCDSSDACVSGAFCDLNDQHCRERQPDGARCDDGRGCATRYCVYDELDQGTCGEPTVDAEECSEAGAWR